MFKYKINVMEALAAAGYSSYQLRINKILGEASIQNIRDGKIVGIKALDQLCTLLDLQPGDIIEHIK